jgi:phosphatidylglycerophosphate synthase
MTQLEAPALARVVGQTYVSRVGQSPEIWPVVQVADGPPSAVPPSALEPVVRVTGPTLLTLAGYASSLAWIAGAHPVFGLLGLVLDEADGRLARATGQVSRFGGELDYAADLTLTGLSMVKAFGAPGLLALPVVTAVQAAMRAQGERPHLGSARAALFVAALVVGR